MNKFKKALLGIVSAACLVTGATVAFGAGIGSDTFTTTYAGSDLSNPVKTGANGNLNLSVDTNGTVTSGENTLQVHLYEDDGVSGDDFIGSYLFYVEDMWTDTPELTSRTISNIESYDLDGSSEVYAQYEWSYGMSGGGTTTVYFTEY